MIQESQQLNPLKLFITLALYKDSLKLVQFESCI